MPDPALRPGISSVQPTDELACLRLSRDRARVVLSTMRRVLADREIDDRDVMSFVASLREQLADHLSERPPAFQASDATTQQTLQSRLAESADDPRVQIHGQAK